MLTEVLADAPMPRVTPELNRVTPELNRVKLGTAIVSGTTIVDVLVPETPVIVTLYSPGLAEVAAASVRVL